MASSNCSGVTLRMVPLSARSGECGDAVFAVEIPPGLDGPPGEADGLAVLVLEGHGGDCLVAGEHGLARGVFECSEHPHFEIIADAFHVAAQGGELPARGWMGVSCCR